MSKDTAAKEGRATPTDVLLALGQSALNRGDHQQAYQWFDCAARSAEPRALNMLGRCFEQGWGISANPQQAARLFLRAAEGGDPWGMFNLADLYYRGIGVPGCAATAYDWYSQAARLGHAKALNMLGLLHEDGHGSPHDAAAFFQAAAEGGDCWGCFNLARLYLKEGKTAQALGWFRRSLDYGFPDFFRAVATALASQTDPDLRALSHQAHRLAHQGRPAPDRGIRS